MDNNELLEKYYNERLKNNWGVCFSKLDPVTKLELSNTISFVGYKLNIATNKLGFEIKKTLKKYGINL
jgi:hypothetical protein